MVMARFEKTNPLNAPRRPVMATIATAHFDATLKAYQSELEYKVLDRRMLPEDLALHWGMPELKGARSVMMGPQSGAPVFLRFVEIETTDPEMKRSEALDPKARPSKEGRCGWFALEICVKDVEELYTRLMSGGVFKPFAEPKLMPHTDRVYPMQCRGPSGEILYLNEVRGSLPDIDLFTATSYVDHLFIAILSAPDMEASNAFYGKLLDMTVNERHELAYKTINRVHGLPLETLHKLSTLGGPRQVALEVDQYPVGAAAIGTVLQRGVEEGILMVSFTVEAFGALPQDTKVQPRTFLAAPYDGAQSVVCVGPGGERVELIKL